MCGNSGEADVARVSALGISAPGHWNGTASQVYRSGGSEAVLAFFKTLGAAAGRAPAAGGQLSGGNMVERDRAFIESVRQPEFRSSHGAL